MDTTNKFLVSVGSSSILFLKPVPRAISYEDALLLAAYLVALVGDDEQWDAVKRAVENT